MTEPAVPPLLCFAAGVLLGAFYFGGLRLTLRRLPGSGQPALLALVSFMGRSAVCLLGFYLVEESGVLALVTSVAGFISIKVALALWFGFDRGSG